MKQITLLLIAALSIFLFACEGPEGPAGADGIDGNANVKSVTFTVYPQNWEYGSGLYVYDYPTDLLTQSVVNNGSVHLYLAMDNDVWLALPYYTLGYGIAIGSLGIFTEGDATSTISVFKLVAIDGTPSSYNYPVDFNNYEEVEEYFKLID
ncbi:MAG: hypothetical protein EOL88_12435 [Bacteroidia bacterium]|nr:hypothetical protein [Bacteroidales bacterium]NCD42883.1 hypothetical protein [Bacteroidia bacterium]MDD3010709.1 hypothetical protein [Bacteroidales bacterium]MDD3962167.1 hypothetical protein [Bacteroidales bacterium]MDY0285132.1 hypothetical protein [Bacteroidales bacterium]